MMTPASLRFPLVTLAIPALLAVTACNGSTTGAGWPDRPESAAGAAGVGGAAGAPGSGGAAGSSGGDAGSATGRCGELDPTLADGDATELFYAPHVPTFDLYLPPATWDALRATAVEELYAEAEACFDGRGLGRVGLRFKGSYGSLYECAESLGEGECRKLSMKIKFNEYVEEQRFFGLKRLNFNANRYDDSRIKERLAYDLFRAMGLVTPRAAWAVLRVNDESLGLFGMVEQVDGRFTADRWPDNPDGNLFKEAWPTETSEAYLTEQLRTNEEIADVSAFFAFAEAMSTAPADELRDTLGGFVDLDQLARFLAVEDAVASYDGITYFWTDGSSVGNHNYYFYEESPDRFTLIPWDVESTFWINPEHAPPHWTEPPGDCSLTYPYWGGLARAPGCDRVMQALAADLTGWRAAAQELLDGPFSEATMLAAIDAHADLVRTEALADPTPSSYDGFEAGVDWLRSTIPELRERLAALTAEP